MDSIIFRQSSININFGSQFLIYETSVTLRICSLNSVSAVLLSVSETRSYTFTDLTTTYFVTLRKTLNFSKPQLSHR